MLKLCTGDTLCHSHSQGTGGTSHYLLDVQTVHHNTRSRYRRYTLPPVTLSMKTSRSVGAPTGLAANHPRAAHSPRHIGIPTASASPSPAPANSPPWRGVAALDAPFSAAAAAAARLRSDLGDDPPVYCQGGRTGEEASAGGPPSPSPHLGCVPLSAAGGPPSPAPMATQLSTAVLLPPTAVVSVWRQSSRKEPPPYCSNALRMCAAVASMSLCSSTRAGRQGERGVWTKRRSGHSHTTTGEGGQSGGIPLGWSTPSGPP